jgi:hypothetical protein
MGHGRPRTAIGTFGGFTFVSAPNGKVRARVRYRDDDGQLRLVQATGDSPGMLLDSVRRDYFLVDLWTLEQVLTKRAS